MRTRIHFVVTILASILVFGPSQRALADAADDLEQAQAYEEKGRYEQAEQLYKAIVAGQAGTDYGLQAQKQLVCLYIATNRLMEADTALGELIADFSAQEGLAQAVHDIAYRYRGADKNDKANEVDQYVIDAWPQSDCALLGQMDIAKYYVDKGNDADAQAAVNKLLGNFPGNSLMARAVHDIAQHYRRSGNYEKANELYKCVAANWPDSEYALWSQADLIKSYLALGDSAGAEAAVEGLLTGFADSPLIARAAWDTAQCFGEHKKYAEAIRLYQHITAKYPDSEHALKAQMDLVKTYLTLKDDAGAGAAIGGLVGNFSKNPGAARAIWEIGQYCRELKKYSQANVLYKHVVANWPDSEDALWAQADLIKSYLALEDETNAEAAVEGLVGNFSDNPLAPRALWDTAQRYGELKRYAEAARLYEHVATNYPDSEHGLKAQMDLVKSYLALGDDPNVEGAINGLIGKFNDNPGAARAIWEVGQHCRELKEYSQANRLYQHVVGNWPDSEDALWSQADLIKSYLAAGDDPNAEIAVEKLLADFSENPLISRAVHDTAFEYRKLAKYDRADELDQFVIDKWPGDVQAMWAKMDMAKTNVRLGNDDAVEAAVESLIADFNDQLEVANAVFQLGEEYYNRAYGELNHGRQLDSEESFRGALSVWGRVIFETADANSTIMAHAHYFSALCYRKLEDQGKAIEYFQETVGRWPEYQFSWNAQFLMARSLEELVRRKEIPPGDAAVMIRDACQEVITKYPDCLAVKAAGDMLKRWNSVN